MSERVSSRNMALPTKFKNVVLFLSIYWSYSIANTLDGETSIAESEATLDTNGNIRLKWIVDYDSRIIKFSIKFSEKAPKFNWFAFGFSDRGEMDDVDVCLLWIDYNGDENYEDMHSKKDTTLTRDKIQNCDKFKVDSIHRSISFERPFDTCDKDDYVIEEGTVHIIWAHGDDKLFTSEGLCLACASESKRGFIRVRLFTPPPLPKPKALAVQFLNKNLKVPEGNTTYWCKVMMLPKQVVEKPHHIVQYESTITKGNEGLVHHMELFYCDLDPKIIVPAYSGNCFAKERPELTKQCTKVKAAWAMGANPFIYPKETGLPIGGHNSNKYVMLEVHYNNPQMKNDWVDSSGITIYVTPHLRMYNAGIIELGLEYTDKMAIPGRQFAFPLIGHCIPECTGVGLPSNGIIVFGSQLHTHLTGVGVYTRHFRQGKELPLLNVDLHYSTHFQEIRLLHNYVHVMPGDYLETTCIFRTTDKPLATVGGHAISDEMCVNYIHYYPATNLEVCKSSVSNKDLEKYFQFEMKYDGMPISNKSAPRGNYLAIEPWTPLRAETLHQLYTESTISMQCNKSDGHRFQGEWEGISFPKIKSQLPLSQKCTRA